MGGGTAARRMALVAFSHQIMCSCFNKTVFTIFDFWRFLRGKNLRKKKVAKHKLDD